MNLAKTTLLTTISTIVKAISAIIINKALAVISGPSGVAIFGQFQNFVLIVSTFANGGTSTGIVKFSSQFKSSIENKARILSTAILLSLGFSFSAGVLIFLFSSSLSTHVLRDIEYQNVFRVVGITVFFLALNNTFLAIFNGHNDVKKFVSIEIFSSLSILILTILLIMHLGLKGAMYAAIIAPGFIFALSLALLFKSNWFSLSLFTAGIDKTALLNLGKFSLMTLTSVIFPPLGQLFVRNHIGETIGWDQAGIWQGLWYISSGYLMIITSSMNVYYLPRLSETDDPSSLRKEIFKVSRFVIPIFAFSALTIYLCRTQIIELAFNKQFMAMSDLFCWQLIGDAIKISSWIFSYLMLAKSMFKAFILTEIIFSVFYVVISTSMVDSFGLIGITYAHCINYSIYLIATIMIVRSRLENQARLNQTEC